MKIGAKLRNLRHKMGLTQSELADRCDLSKGFISLLESDRTSPSLSTLEDILTTLGVGLEEFFAERSPRVVYSEEDTVLREMDGGAYGVRWLVSDAQKNMMEPIAVTIGPGQSTALDEPHAGEEFGYVLSGRIVLELDTLRHAVKKGESFYFEPDVPHRLTNPGKTEARVLWVSSPPSF